MGQMNCQLRIINTLDMFLVHKVGTVALKEAFTQLILHFLQAADDRKALERGIKIDVLAAGFHIDQIRKQYTPGFTAQLNGQLLLIIGTATAQPVHNAVKQSLVYFHTC